MNERSVYTLKTGEGDRDRLQLLARYYNPSSMRFLRAAGVSADQRVLDVGCGQGQITYFLGELVGPAGRVVGVDRGADQLAIAEANNPYPERIRFRCGPAEQLEFARGGFDVVYCRLLLMHVADPMHVLRAMIHALVPGGLLLVETAVVSDVHFVPAHEGSELWKEWWFALGDAIGAAYRFPARAPLRIRELGLRVEHMESVQPMSFERDAKLLHILGFEQLLPAYREHAGAAEADIERARRAYAASLEDEGAYVELYRMLQIAAR